jgi:predicted DNA-binding transcriptional regulator YafY
MDIYTGEVIGNIKKAGQERKVLIIEYRDKGGVVTERETHPYEMRDGAYWGYDPSKGSIRRFTITNIMSAKISDETFIPQWPIKL